MSVFQNRYKGKKYDESGTAFIFFATRSSPFDRLMQGRTKQNPPVSYDLHN